VKVLLLSAYAAHSHRYWERALRLMFPAWQWRVLSLPPRHFSWRVRGNALYWSMAQRAELEREYDLAVATSMVDLATLRGLVPALARVPTVLYFHENQFDFPLHQQRHSPVEAQITSIYSALAADQVLFNSRYNLDSFLDGCEALLQKLPDRVPPGVAADLRQKSQVLPVPLVDTAFTQSEPEWPGAGNHRVLRLLWVGRFEHDKGGEGLLLALRCLEAAGRDFELAVTGPQFRRSPACFEQIREAFHHRLVHFGYLEDEARYGALLAGADVVLSTALHEFQGLGVLEAVARGCVPVVPDRLAYREMYPAWCRYPSHPDDGAREARGAADLILELADGLEHGSVIPPDVSAFSMRSLAPRYADLFRGFAGR